jgi:transposase InsO family protein
MDVVDADSYVIGEAPAPIAVVTDNGPCFRGVTFAHAFAGDDPLFYRATIGDGNALAVEVNLFRHTYNTLRPHQALDERTPRAAYLAVEHCD